MDINPYELSKRLRLMANESDLNLGNQPHNEYWLGWQAAIGSHLSTMQQAADMIEMLAEVNATLRQEAM